jgi:hypothetical protein
MEPKLRKIYVSIISQTVSWFDRLRETNAWAALTPDEQKKEQKEREKIHAIRPAGLKPRRSFSYTKTTKSSCF